MQDLVVVVPCYNEAARLPTSSFIEAARLDATLSFVFVDDGSKDGTRELLTQLRATKGQQFSVLGLDQNVGKAEAVRRGMQFAFGLAPSLVAYFDADLATPLSELDVMRALFVTRRDLQAVFGARVALLGHQVMRDPSRHYFGRAFATLASLAVGATVYDTQCGAKVFRNSAAIRSLFGERFAARWTFDVEILARLKALASEGQIAPLQTAATEWPLARWRDVSGSKVKPMDGLRGIKEVLALSLDYRHGWRRKITPLPDHVPFGTEQRHSEIRAVGDNRRSNDVVPVNADVDLRQVQANAGIAVAK